MITRFESISDFGELRSLVAERDLESLALKNFEPDYHEAPQWIRYVVDKLSLEELLPLFWGSCHVKRFRGIEFCMSLETTGTLRRSQEQFKTLMESQISLTQNPISPPRPVRPGQASGVFQLLPWSPSSIHRVMSEITIQEVSRFREAVFMVRDEFSAPNIQSYLDVISERLPSYCLDPESPGIEVPAFPFLEHENPSLSYLYQIVSHVTNVKLENKLSYRGLTYAVDPCRYRGGALALKCDVWDERLMSPQSMYLEWWCATLKEISTFLGGVPKLEDRDLIKSLLISQLTKLNRTAFGF